MLDSIRKLTQKIFNAEKSDCENWLEISRDINTNWVLENVKDLTTYCKALDYSCKERKIKGYSYSYTSGFASMALNIDKQMGADAGDTWGAIWAQLGKSGMKQNLMIIKSASRTQLIDWAYNGLTDTLQAKKDDKETSTINRVEKEVFALMLESMPASFRNAAKILNKTKGQFDKAGNVKHTLLTIEELGTLPDDMQALYRKLGLNIIVEIVTA